jgi:hypothetical protein
MDAITLTFALSVFGRGACLSVRPEKPFIADDTRFG